ncbi:TolC family protein [Desulfovibrio litoralis]|uniref:Outer membrane protein n=1 Tax=Desulfovibrio litoralis DSM 11393 TaxID=1121455 RepID=A0A1M7T6T2_9BACT|nr:TolC family protein [Desulfovibrio litoralis]SHN66404.1 outer membrane protein [Desulfovibrio litoralis DSM 11393]
MLLINKKNITKFLLSFVIVYTSLFLFSFFSVAYANEPLINYEDAELGEKEYEAEYKQKKNKRKNFTPVTPPSSTKVSSLGVDEYDMERAVLRALKENPSVKAKESAALSSEQARKAARSAFGPVFSTSYGYTQVQHPQRIGGMERDDAVFTYSATVSQNLFAGLATLSGYRKSELLKESAEADKNRNDIQLILDVQQNFLNLFKTRENIRSAQDSLERLQSQLKVSEAFYDVGLRPRLDVLQSEVDVAAAEDILLQAKQAEETIIARLDTLLNINIKNQVNYVGSLAKVPFPFSLEECLERAYRQRPDVYIAQKAVQISGEDTRLAASGFYPQVNTSWSWQTEGTGMAAAGSAKNPNRYSNWQLGIQADWNVFEWGRTYYTFRQQKYLEGKAGAEQASLHNEVAFEIKSKLLQLNQASKRIDVSRKGLTQAREAYRMADARHQAQVATITDVLDAQSKLSAAEASYTSALADYAIAVANLYAAMGEKHPDLSVATQAILPLKYQD